jgi:integrase
MTNQSTQQVVYESKLISAEQIDPVVELAKILGYRELRPKIERTLNQPHPSCKAGMTIDATTILNQTRVAESLILRFRREQAVYVPLFDFPFVRFANWMLAGRFRVQRDTHYKYIHYVIEYLNDLPGDEVTQAISLLTNGADTELEDEIRKTQIKGSGESFVKSLEIVKLFPYSDLEYLTNHLRFNSNSKTAGDLVALLEASIITGLRPIEWAAATIVRVKDAQLGRARTFLVVANAKRTNGRANGVLRTQELSDLCPQAIDPIAHTINLAQELDVYGKYEEKFLDLFTKQMHKTVRKLWPGVPGKRYVLTSCRHQASSNWKSLMSAIEVAALSGHATPNTTQRWYGHQREAWPKELLKNIVRPVNAEVEMIKSRVEMHQHYESASKQSLLTQPVVGQNPSIIIGLNVDRERIQR